MIILKPPLLDLEATFLKLHRITAKYIKCPFAHFCIMLIELYNSSGCPTRSKGALPLANSCKKLTLTLLTHKSPKHTIASIEINHFLYKLNH